MLEKLKKKIQRQFQDKSLHELVTGSAVSFIMRVIGMLVSYVFTFIISHVYGAVVLGAFAISQVVLNMFTIFSRLGMDTAIVKLFASNIALNKWPSVLGIYKKVLSISIPIGIVTTLVLFFGADWIALYIFDKPELATEFRIISFAIIPMSIRFINSDSYRGFKLLKLYNYSKNISYFLYACVLLGVLSFFKDSTLIKPLTKFLPNIAFTISLILLAISSTYLIFKYIKTHTTEVDCKITKRDILTQSMPMMLSSSLLLMSGWINTLFLARYGTTADVGIYKVVLQVTTVCGFILLSVNAVAAPKFAELWAKGDTKELGNAARQTSKINFFASMPIFLIIIVFREFILGLFGEEFKVAGTILLFNMIGQFFNIFSGSCGSFLNMTGHQKSFQNILLVSTLFNIIACFIFIPMFGLLGSAICSMIFMSTWNILSLVYIKMKFNVKTYYWPF